MSVEEHGRLSAVERQDLILGLARDNGRVEVARLAEDLDVTPETIRRDLTRLERLGRIRRVHGGAIPLDALAQESPVDQRRTAMSTEKERIAKLAVGLVPDGGAILLDAGTTTAALAALLPEDRELTVVTNSLDIATTLARKPLVQVLVLGGRLRSKTLATVDSWAADMLRTIYVDVAFVATNGVSAQRGLTTPDPNEAVIKGLMVSSARRAILLADHTKVGNDHLVRFAELDQIDTVVTDAQLNDELRRELEDAGPEVVLA